MVFFKKKYQNCYFICIVHNARAHVAAEFSICDSGMKPMASDVQSMKTGLARELQFSIPEKCTLSLLKSLLAKHVAFKHVSRLFIPYSLDLR